MGPDPGPADDEARDVRVTARLMTAGRFGMTVLVVLLLATFAAFSLGGAVVSTLEGTLGALGAWGPAVFVLSFTVLAALGVPRAALTVMGALLFGPLPGAVMAWLASLLAALLAFVAGRRLLPPPGPWLGSVSSRRAEAVSRRLAALRLTADVGSGWMVLVARLSPVPFWLVSWGAGALRVPWAAYAAGSALGLVPSAIGYAAAGWYGADLATSGWLGWLGLAAAAAVAAAVQIRGRSRHRQAGHVL